MEISRTPRLDRAVAWSINLDLSDTERRAVLMEVRDWDIKRFLEITMRESHTLILSPASTVF